MNNRPFADTKVAEKSVEFIFVIGPGLRYIKTAKKVTKFINPVKATTYTARMSLKTCDGKQVKYTVLCSAWATSTTIDLVTGSSALVVVRLEAGNKIIKYFYGE